jgi:hypothetical protein
MPVFSVKTQLYYEYLTNQLHVSATLVAIIRPILMYISCKIRDLPILQLYYFLL